MQLLKDVAQQARFAAMLPAASLARAPTDTGADDDIDAAVFERAAWWAQQALMWRRFKAAPVKGHSAAHCESSARKAERTVREIALQSEIILQRRHDDAQADRAMLGIMLGAAS